MTTGLPIDPSHPLVTADTSTYAPSDTASADPDSPAYAELDQDLPPTPLPPDHATDLTLLLDRAYDELRLLRHLGIRP